MKRQKQILLGFLLLFLNLTFCSKVLASDESIRITTLNNPAPGYMFLGPVGFSKTTGAYDNSFKPVYKGTVPVHTGDSTTIIDFKSISNNRFIGYCLPVEKWYIFSYDFVLLDSISLPSDYHNDMHDIVQLPNGHFLIIGTERRYVNMAEIVEGGSENALIDDNIIFEIDHNQNIYFRWSCLDSIDILQSTEDIRLTDNHIDPYHINSLFVDADGNIITSIRHLDQVVKINRTSGSIMWRMGGTKSRRNDFTFINDTYNSFTGFSHQHHAQRLSSGNIILFDNGNLKNPPYSRVVEYEIDETARTLTKVWEYTHNYNIYNYAKGSVTRLENGNTLIGWGISNGTTQPYLLTEVKPDGTIALELEGDGGDGGLYRAYKYVYKMDAVEKNITTYANYSFQNAQYTTGINLDIEYKNANGKLLVEKHRYAPHSFNTNFGSVCVQFPVRWVITSDDIDSLYGKISIDASTIPNFYYSSFLKIYRRDKENSGNFQPVTTTYNQQTNRLEAYMKLTGEITVGINEYESPELTLPLDDAEGVSTSPTLSWNEINSTEIYEIQLSDSPDFTRIIRDTVNYPNNSIQCSGLENNTNYYWRVRTTNEGCISQWSEVFNFTTSISRTMLQSPSDNAKEIQKDGVILKWTVVSGATNYSIQVAEDPNFITKKLDKRLGNESSYTIEELKGFTDYYWRVRAENNTNPGEWSATFTFQTAMSAPKLIYPEQGAVGIDIIGKLTWEKLPNAAHYTMLISKDSIFREIVVNAVSLPSNECQVDNLENITTYFWKVRAHSTETVSPWSETRIFKTTLAKPVFNQTIPKYKDNDFNLIVKWDLVPEADLYKFEISRDSSFTDLFETKESYNTYLEVIKLGYDNNYYYRCKAVNKEIESPWSTVGTCSVTKPSEVVAPILLYPVDDSYGNAIDVELQWMNQMDISRQMLLISQDSEFLEYEEYALDSTITKYLVSGLDYNTSYYWKIKVEKNGKFSEWTKPNKFTSRLEQTVLLSPINLDSNISISTELVWSSVAGAEYYELELSKDNDPNQIIIEKDNLTETRYVPGILQNNQMYSWRIKAKNMKNYGDWSSWQSFVTEGIISGVDLVSDEINIYPNPASDIVNISIPALGI